MKDQIRPLVLQAIARLQTDGLLPGDSQPAFVIERTRNREHGDFACNAALLLAKPALCNVQGVRKLALDQARRTLARVNCRVGSVSRAYSKRIKRGLVISQKPKFGTVRRGGAKVNLVISRGPRR